MAAPVITSKLAIDVIVNVTIHYTIRASNGPTSFNAFNMPAQMRVDFTTGRLGGQVREAGVYEVDIEATNDDGTGTATLVVTATDSGGGTPPTNGISAFQAKQWKDNLERIDYFDLDSTGQPLLEFDTDSIGTDQLAADAIANKITAIGGPGVPGRFTLPADFILPNAARATVTVGTVDAIGTKNGDIVVLNEMLLADGTAPDPVYNCTFFARATANAVSIFSFQNSSAPGTLPKGAYWNFRIFNF